MNKDFARGMIVSMALKALPVRKKSPIAYLYNGVRLPALPEWDREAFPYVYICDADGVYLFNYGATKVEAYNTGSVVATNVFKYSDGSWTKTTWVSFPGAYPLVWSNYDIYYKTNESYGELSGALCMAGSDPIPIYNEPVNYLYNGVKLPKLPEWDKTVYPYVCMTTNSNNSVVNLHMSSEPVVYDGKLNGTVIRTAYVPKPRLFASWTENNNAWGEIAEPSTDYNIYYSNPLIWTNTDIVKGNGDVYMVASDPVPVYE